MFQPRSSVLRLWPVPACFLLLACGTETPRPTIARPELATPSPPQSAAYAFSRSERIERVVAKLVGNTTSAAWNFAKTLAARESDPEYVRELITFVDEQRLETLETAGIRNGIQGMEASGLEVYSGALARLMEFPQQEVRDDALRALVRCAAPAELDRFAESYERADDRRRAQFLRIFAVKLAPERAAPFFRTEMSARLSQLQATTMREQVLIALEQENVPKDTIRLALEGLLGAFPPDKRLRAARLLHRAGGPEGRVALVELLKAAGEPGQKTAFVLALAEGPAQEALPLVLELSVSEDPMLLAAVAQFLGSEDALGQQESVERANALRTLEFLAASEIPAVRSAALHALGERGLRLALPSLEEAIRTGTGSTLRRAIETAISLEAEELVDELVARLATTEGRGRRILLQGIGRIGHEKGVAPLVAEFLAPPQMLDPDKDLDTVSYSMLMLANVPASLDRLLRLHAELGGRDADGKRLAPAQLLDVPQADVRRAHVRNTIALLANGSPRDAAGAERRERVRRFLLAAAGPEPAQPLPGTDKDDAASGAGTISAAEERLHALSLLKSLIRIEDTQQLVQMLRQADEDSEFERYLGDFLWEFF